MIAAVRSPDFRALRARFIGLDERAHFVSHSFGPLLTETLSDLDAYRASVLLRHRAVEGWLGRLDAMRGLLAELVGAAPDEIALGPNTTASLGNLLAAFRPTPGRDVILTTDLEFPSLAYLLAAQEKRGFRVTTIPSLDGIGMPTEALIAALDERVVLVVVSLASYKNGALLAAAPLIEAAHAVGALVVLDAYQAAGIVPINVRALDVDALASGTNKWLSAAGTGLSFLYVRRALAERLDPASPGWFAHAAPFGFSRDFTPAPGARRFEQGAPSVEAVYASRAGVCFALDHGVAAMRTRSLALSDHLVAGADALRLPVLTPRAHAQRAGVVCLALPDPERVASALRECAVDVDTRPGAGLRLSTHPCNTEDEVDRFLVELACVMRA